MELITLALFSMSLHVICNYIFTALNVVFLFINYKYQSCHLNAIFFLELSELLLSIGARCSSVVRAFTHGVMGRWIDSSWWTH